MNLDVANRRDFYGENGADEQQLYRGTENGDCTAGTEENMSYREVAKQLGILNKTKVVV